MLSKAADTERKKLDEKQRKRMKHYERVRGGQQEVVLITSNSSLLEVVCNYLK